MSASSNVTVSHFSDVLCIWTYIAQIRIDELKSEFGDSVELKYHFLPVFGSVNAFMENYWDAKGGIEAYNKHVISIASRYSHVEVNSNVWLVNRPTSSLGCHLFLKALQLLESEGALRNVDDKATEVEKFAWELRLAFFRDLLDVSDYDVQIALAEKQGLPIDKIRNKIKNGEAYAALDIDSQLKHTYHLFGSPTLIFNKGRQILYGNVGYRVIEANIRELLNQPDNQASWC
jgi:predicted DsbA family dithiol-disulfide isomerase